MLPSRRQCRGELAFHFNCMSVYVCQKANIMHSGTLHDTCQDQEMAVLCFPIPLLHQDGLVPFLTVERRMITQLLSSNVSFIRTLSCLILALLLSLLHSYISL